MQVDKIRARMGRTNFQEACLAASVMHSIPFPDKAFLKPWEMNRGGYFCLAIAASQLLFRSHAYKNPKNFIYLPLRI
jgi:hypothetical protein